MENIVFTQKEDEQNHKVKEKKKRKKA